MDNLGICSVCRFPLFRTKDGNIVCLDGDGSHADAAEIMHLSAKVGELATCLKRAASIVKHHAPGMYPEFEAEMAKVLAKSEGCD